MLEVVLPDLQFRKNLNLGCGADIRPDCVNLDRASLPGVDVVHDMSQLPLPFSADRFSHIVCQDVLEQRASHGLEKMTSAATNSASVQRVTTETGIAAPPLSNRPDGCRDRQWRWPPAAAHTGAALCLLA